MQKLLTFFSKNISVYAIFNDQKFNDTLTNNVCFEQLNLVNFKLLDLLLELQCKKTYLWACAPNED